MSKIKSIKNKLASFVVILILFFGALAAITVFFSARNIFIKQAKEDLERNAFSQIEDLKQVFGFSQDLAKTISEQVWVKNFLENNPSLQDEEILSYLNMYNVDNKYSSIYLMNKEGNTLVSTANSFVGKNYSFRDYFQEAIKNESWVDVARGVTSQKVGYYFSHSVLNSQKDVIGVIVLKMKPEYIHQSMYLSELNLDLHFMFTDINGVVIYADKKERTYKSLGKMTFNQRQNNQDKKRFSGLEIKPLSYDLIQEDLSKIKNNKIYNFYDKSDNEQKILTVTPIKNLNFFLVTEKNLDQYVQLASKLSIALSFFVALAALIAAITILILINRILKPLVSLKEGVNKISQGNLDYQINLKTKDEFFDLAQSFNKMALKIKKTRTGIEKKIADRTMKLEKLNRHMVGRELKMIELKKEILNLKNGNKK